MNSYVGKDISKYQYILDETRKKKKSKEEFNSRICDFEQFLFVFLQQVS